MLTPIIGPDPYENLDSDDRSPRSTVECPGCGADRDPRDTEHRCSPPCDVHGCDEDRVFAVEYCHEHAHILAEYSFVTTFEVERDGETIPVTVAGDFCWSTDGGTGSVRDVEVLWVSRDDLTAAEDRQAADALYAAMEAARADSLEGLA